MLRVWVERGYITIWHTPPRMLKSLKYYSLLWICYMMRPSSCVRGVCYRMWSALRERRGTAERAVKSKAATAMVVVALMSSSARVEAFKAAGAATSAHMARARLSACAAAAEPTSRPQQAEANSSHGDQARRSPNGEDSRGFFERLGSPRYIAAPMVEHSEAVS